MHTDMYVLQVIHASDVELLGGTQIATTRHCPKLITTHHWFSFLFLSFLKIFINPHQPVT